MLRKKTQFEEKLERKGFKLVEKTYKGNKSQFVEFYVYKGYVGSYSVILFLVPKRDRVDHYEIVNTMAFSLYREDIEELNRVCDEIYNIIYSNYENVEEIVETVEVIENESRD